VDWGYASATPQPVSMAVMCFDKMEKSKKFTLVPKKFSDWIMLTGCIVCVASILLRYTILSVDLNSPDESFIYNRITRLIGDIAISMSVFCFIIIRIRFIRKEGYSIKKIIYPLIGISFCIIFMLISFSDSKMLLRTYQIVSKPFDDMRLQTLANDQELSISIRLNFRDSPV
jgi:hypothetical protein